MSRQCSLKTALAEASADQLIFIRPVSWIGSRSALQVTKLGMWQLVTIVAQDYSDSSNKLTQYDINPNPVVDPCHLQEKWQILNKSEFKKRG